MSNEMIERVAAALRQAMASLSNPEAETLARAAIAATREPTAEMVEEGAFVSLYGDDIVGRQRAKECWQAMIDVALTELGPLRPAGSADRYGVPKAEE